MILYGNEGVKMKENEMRILKRIPKKYREHIVNLSISKSGYFNDRGQELNNYTLIWDNGDEHTFDNQSYMIWYIKEYTENGYLSDV